MKQPYIDAQSTDEDFAEFAKYLNSVAESCDIHAKPGGANGNDPYYIIGRLRSATGFLARTMQSALDWRKQERAEVRLRSQFRRERLRHQRNR